MSETREPDERDLVLESWKGIVHDLDSVARGSSIHPLHLNISEPVDRGNGRFHMRMRVLGVDTDKHPELISGYLFMRDPNEDNDGELLQIVTVRAFWANGIASIGQFSSLPLDPDSIMPFTSLQISEIAKETVAKGTLDMPRAIPYIPYVPQTDLLQ